MMQPGSYFVCDENHLGWEGKWSGQEDLNLRPHGPEPCALTRLSYAPKGTRILGESRRAVKRQSHAIHSDCTALPESKGSSAMKRFAIALSALVALSALGQNPPRFGENLDVNLVAPRRRRHRLSRPPDPRPRQERLHRQRERRRPAGRVRRVLHEPDAPQRARREGAVQSRADARRALLHLLLRQAARSSSFGTASRSPATRRRTSSMR